MASGGNVVIRLVTKYVGKGVDLMKAAMTTTGRIVMRTANAIAGALGSALNKAGTQVGGFVSSLGSLGQMLAQGGVWGLAQFAVTKVIGKIGEMVEASKKAAAEMRRAFADSLLMAADKVERQFKRITDAVAAAAKEGKRLLELGQSKGEFNVNAQTRDVNYKTRNWLAAAKSDSERAVIEAEGRLEIAQIEEAERIKVESAKREEAAAALVRAEERVSAAEEALEQLTQKRLKLVEEYNRAKFAENKDEERIKAATENLDKMAAREAKAEEDLASAEEAEADARNALAIADLRVHKAYYARSDKLAAAEFALTEARKKAAAEEKARAQREKYASLEAGIAQREREMLAKAETAADKEVVKAQVALARARLAEANASDGEEAERTRLAAATAAAQWALDEARAKKVAADEESRLAAEERKARDAMAEAYRQMAEQGRNRLRDMGPGLVELDRQVGAFAEQIAKVKGNAARVNDAVSRFGRSTGRAGFLFTDWQKARVRQEEAVAADAKADSKSQERYNRLARWRDRGGRLRGGDAQFVSDWEAYRDAKNGAGDLEQKRAEAEKKRDALRKDMVEILKEINMNIKEANTLE